MEKQLSTENVSESPNSPNSVTSSERVVISYSTKSNTLKIAITGIMTAMVCVSTLLIRIPIPSTGGYFNIGEAMIFITALLLGSYFGGFAGGVGSALADLFSGYFVFMPITFIVKGLEGIIVGWIHHKLINFNFRYHLSAKYIARYRVLLNVLRHVVVKIIAILCGAPIMILGYFFAEYFILSLGEVAIIEIPINIIQMSVGAVIAVPVTLLLEKSKLIQNLQT